VNTFSIDSSDKPLVRLAVATYLLGQMLETPINARPNSSETPKERKVKAAIEYADLLINFIITE